MGGRVGGRCRSHAAGRQARTGKGPPALAPCLVAPRHLTHATCTPRASRPAPRTMRPARRCDLPALTFSTPILCCTLPQCAQVRTAPQTRQHGRCWPSCATSLPRPASHLVQNLVDAALALLRRGGVRQSQLGRVAQRLLTCQVHIQQVVLQRQTGGQRPGGWARAASPCAGTAPSRQQPAAAAPGLPAKSIMRV